MLSMIQLTRADSQAKLMIPADAIKRIDARANPEEPCCKVYAPEAGGEFDVEESAVTVAVSVNTAINWKETCIIRGQVEMAQQLQKHSSGVVIPKNRMNGI